MEISVILLRLFITFALSCVFGVERQKSHKPIGFGAFIYKLFEKQGVGYYQKKLVINTNKIIDKVEVKNLLLSLIGTKKYRFISVELDKKNTKLSITYLIEGTSEQIRGISNALFEKDWFDSCKIE